LGLKISQIKAGEGRRKERIRRRKRRRKMLRKGKGG
jgi:hypothetical protein